MLDKYLYVVYDCYNEVQVFSCEDRFKKIKDIQVNEISCPGDMVGCSVTSQLFISDNYNENIIRVNVNTGVSDVFIKLGYRRAWLSLVENRLLVTSHDSLLMYDILSGLRMKNIPLTEDLKKYEVYHAIESNRNSFFMSHGQSKDNIRTVSEIDSEGRVIREFDNKEQLNCAYLALDSAGRLFVADWKNDRVVLLHEYLKFITVLIDKERFIDGAPPVRLNYNKNNNRLAVGFYDGRVKIFDCHV